MEYYRERDYSFKMPILLIWGSEDMVVPVSTGDKLTTYCGENATLEVVDGAAHMPNMTHKRIFNDHVSNFLEISK
jgi:pimeloyl-ACP methyl ester carboxylesterase